MKWHIAPSNSARSYLRRKRCIFQIFLLVAREYHIIKILFEVSHGLSGCVVYVFEDENGFFIEQPYNGIFSVSRLPVSRTLLDVPAFPTTIFSLVNILASFGHRKTLLSLILADGYYDGFESRHRNEYTDSGASDLLLPKKWEFFWQSERGILTNPTTFWRIILIESCRILCPQVRYFTKDSIV